MGSNQFLELLFFIGLFCFVFGYELDKRYVLAERVQGRISIGHPLF